MTARQTPESRIATSATWAEIQAQPAIWRAWGPALAAQAAELRDWIAARGITRVLFCGAGTSAFVGETLAFAAPSGLLLQAVPTTDVVSCPAETLADDPRLLVVQFGRSGDSSETVGTLDLLDAHFPQAHRLHVTCNPGGALATRAPVGPGECRVLRLPEATHDAGFAMTSSYTTMLLSALACLDPAADPAARLAWLADAAEAALAAIPAVPRPGRAIFLGSGALRGVARESALKVLELTAGETMTNWDSTLGFRHGPKASVAPGTLVAVMLHPDPHTARYDLDVAREIAAQYPQAKVLTLGRGGDIALPSTGDARWDAVLHVLAAQVWAVRWSAELGLSIDNPFAAHGNLTRVVSGVTLYPFAA